MLSRFDPGRLFAATAALAALARYCASPLFRGVRGLEARDVAHALCLVEEADVAGPHEAGVR